MIASFVKIVSRREQKVDQLFNQLASRVTFDQARAKVSPLKKQEPT
jgi:hypothetical protein